MCSTDILFTFEQIGTFGNIWNKLEFEKIGDFGIKAVGLRRDSTSKELNH